MKPVTTYVEVKVFLIDVLDGGSEVVIVVVEYRYSLFAGLLA